MLTLADPVAVLEQDGLCTALLACGGVGILVALPGHVVEVCHIRPEDLPVKARILQVHLQGEGVRQRLVQVISSESARCSPKTFT